MNTQTLFTAKNVSKRYGPIQALNSVDFEVESGEIMALLGQNGAGKSTLVKIFSGTVTPDAGSYFYNNNEISVKSVQSKVAIVQQELSLIPSLSVAENIFIGGGYRGLWNLTTLREKAKEHLSMLGLEDIDPTTPVEEISLAERQLIEITRAFAKDASILLLDEPTATLSDNEIERVFSVLRKLRKDGKHIVFITHRLGEVMHIADRAIVLKNGENFEPVNISDITVNELVQKMVGKRIDRMFPERCDYSGEKILSISDLKTQQIKRPFSLEVSEGEIIGFAGQIGSGMNSILRAIIGKERVLSGSIKVNEKELENLSLKKAINHGLSHCSNDRRKDGVFVNRNVIENLTSPALDIISNFGLLNIIRQNRIGQRIANNFQIDEKRLADNVDTLSGGNQQKVALGKWLSRNTKLLLIEEPTRGVDVGARSEIYFNLRELSHHGISIIFCSTDLQEVIGFSDRIITFFRGEAVGKYDLHDISEAQILLDITHGRREGNEIIN